jgi:hypothetical protein
MRSEGSQLGSGGPSGLTERISILHELKGAKHFRMDTLGMQSQTASEGRIGACASLLLPPIMLRGQGLRSLDLLAVSQAS